MAKPVYLYVTPFFPTPDSWRCAHGYDFVSAFKRQTDKYDIVVMMPGNGPDFCLDGIQVYRFPVKELPSGTFPFLFRRSNERSFVRKLAELGISPGSVAVCHGHTARFVSYPLAIKRLNPNCLTLLHHHDLCSFGLNLGVLHRSFLYNVWLFCQFRRLFEQIDIHVFISKACQNSFLKAPDASWTIYEDYRRQMRGPAFFHCRPVRIKRSLILHNGVDTSIFHPIPTNHEPRDTNRVFTIGCIGNFTDLKDQMTLISACAHLDKGVLSDCGIREVKLIFVGSGPALSRCKQEVAKLNINAEFVSEVGHEQLPEFYRALDLFVLPSYFEGFGCVFTEAYACGVPFITCMGQGIGDLIFPVDYDKWLCPPTSPLDMRDRIQNFCSNRYHQALAGEIEINALIRIFIEQVNALSERIKQ